MLSSPVSSVLKLDLGSMRIPWLLRSRPFSRTNGVGTTRGTLLLPSLLLTKRGRLSSSRVPLRVSKGILNSSAETI